MAMLGVLLVGIIIGFGTGMWIGVKFAIMMLQKSGVDLQRILDEINEQELRERRL